jgi:signal transduction histidine kinase
MSRAHGRRLTRARLRWTLGCLFLALALPSTVLVVQTQRQLKWEAFHQHRQLAVELAERVDARLRELIAIEEARGYADYSFLNVAGFDSAAAAANRAALLQRSPLAQFPVQSEFPGLLGWFQVDAAGRFASPLLPEPPADLALFGLGADEVAARRALAEQLLDVLGRNELAVRRPLLEPATPAADLKEVLAERGGSAAGAVSSGEQAVVAADPGAPAAYAAAPSSPSPQAAFDQLKRAPDAGRLQAGKALGNVADLRLENAFSERDDRRKDRQEVRAPERGRRLEQTALPLGVDADARAAAVASSAPLPLRIFDSELDPFEFALLGSEHFVLFRRVWRNGERSIQGALIDQQTFLNGAIGTPFQSSLVAPVSDLLVAWQGEVLLQLRGRGNRRAGTDPDSLTGTLLHRARLAAPLADLELIWTIRQLPTSPGLLLVRWAGVVLFAVLLAGFLALYRLGLRQLALAQQQQDFIAAVSHELKTPLTSIRMYGELLRAGWASEEKKREYYDFIHDESERLSRLIANVLQLARLERDELSLELKPVAVATLFDLIRSRVQAQIERAGFEVQFTLDPGLGEAELQVDVDAVVQVMINLVDNALKFAARAPVRRIELAATSAGTERVVFSVRDHGPGVPAALRRRVFEPFFRGGSELTRETQGTGIGLALVSQLAKGMRGEIELESRNPGVEFRLLLPR